LAEVEQADHAHDVQPLDRDDAAGEPDELVLPRRGKREHRRKQHDRRFDAVAARLDRHREAVLGAAQNLSRRHHVGSTSVTSPALIAAS